MQTSPAPARVLSASRTGVLETPSTSARSVSTSACPGLSSPARIACLIASSTATVRDGSAPAAPVRNADAEPAPVAVAPVAVAPVAVAPAAVAPAAEAPAAADEEEGTCGIDIMYRISYMTGVERRRERP